MLDDLRQLDSCALSDALDRLGLRGVVGGLRRLSGPATRLAGRVVTVLLGPPEGAPAVRHLCTAAVEAAGPGQVIVIAHQGRTDCAGWGGILSLAAHQRGIEGVVVDGAARDIDEARELGFSLFASVGVPTTARSRTIEHAWNVPITVGEGIAVCPGDWLLADGSGVVVVAAAQAGEVIKTARMIVDTERAMAEAVRSGKPVSQVMGRSYEELLQAGG